MVRKCLFIMFVLTIKVMFSTQKYQKGESHSLFSPRRGEHSIMEQCVYLHMCPWWNMCVILLQGG